eukprot:GGOE01032448.1.p1 GENE.GGOE01032448.1~~GGOE01032448.1.p1  ORF type:complete len:474 (+),score=122.78 GGOE01032448.1:22-1422(+)
MFADGAMPSPSPSSWEEEGEEEEEEDNEEDEEEDEGSRSTSVGGNRSGEPERWQLLRTMTTDVNHVAEALCHMEAQLRHERREWLRTAREVDLIGRECGQCCYLDIGGMPFHAPRNVLLRSGAYFVTALDCGVRGDDPDSSFIDRDGKHFAAVLAYIRDGSVWVPEEGGDPALHRELQHYGLVGAARQRLVFPYGEPCAHGERWSCLALALFDVKSLVWQTVRLHTRVPDAYRLGYCDGSQLYVVASFDRRATQKVRRFDLQAWQWNHVADLPTRNDDSRSPFSTQLVAGHLCLFDDHGWSNVLVCRLSDGAWVPHPFLREVDPQGYTCCIAERVFALGRRGLMSSALEDAQWRVEPDTPYVSDSSMVAWRGKVLLLGGQDSGAPDGVHNLVHLYDPSTQSWAQLPPMLHHRSLPSVAVADDRIYVVGGGGRDAVPMEMYDLATNMWTELGPAPTFRCMVGFAAHF